MTLERLRLRLMGTSRGCSDDEAVLFFCLYPWYPSETLAYRSRQSYGDGPMSSLNLGKCTIPCFACCIYKEQ